MFLFLQFKFRKNKLNFNICSIGNNNCPKVSSSNTMDQKFDLHNTLERSFSNFLDSFSKCGEKLPKNRVNRRNSP